MARIFVTGSTAGVGKAAAQALAAQGHEVVLHARSADRFVAFGDLARGRDVLVGDLAQMEAVRALARDLDALGPVDAVIHNAGIIDDERVETADGLLRVLMVNALAPYVLSCLARRPGRLIFTGSSMHYGHDGVLEDMEWTRRRWSGAAAYGESKLLVTALCAGLARVWPEIACHTVDPGWVPTRMGGSAASDPLEKAHVTQCWLATARLDEICPNGAYWHHMERRKPDGRVLDPGFQDAVLSRFAQMTGVPLTK